MILEDIVEHGTAKKFKLSKGDKIRIISPKGGQVSDITFKGFNQARTREVLMYDRYYAAKDKNPEARAHRSMPKNLEQGECLYNGKGEPVLELVEDSVTELSKEEYKKWLEDLGKNIDWERMYMEGDKAKATHDLLWPGCSTQSYRDKRKGCRDVLSEVLGIELEELPAVCTLFMNTDIYEYMVPTAVQAGDYVVLEALEEVELGVTSCTSDFWCNPIPSEIKVRVEKR